MIAAVLGKDGREAVEYPFDPVTGNPGVVESLAVAHGSLLPGSPAMGVRPPAKMKELARALSRGQVRALVQARALAPGAQVFPVGST
jgi:hypothetical protein